jgi:copper homeostasis protein
MSQQIILEVIVTNVEEALAAQTGGADRLELIDNYPEGGTTPDPQIIRDVKNAVKIPVQVMLRPRGGNFFYSKTELDAMKESIHLCRQIGVAGIVFGILTADNRIDVESSNEMLALAQGMSATFHAAFDQTPDQFQALETLAQLKGIDRVLTMTLHNDTPEARKKVKEVVQFVRGRISIMPAIGATGAAVIDQIVSQTGVREIHIGRAVRTPHQYTGKIDTEKIARIKKTLPKERVTDSSFG